MPTVPSQSHFRFSQVKSKWGVIYQLFCCLLFSCKDLSKHLSRLAVGRKVIHMGCVLSMELCALSGAMCSVRGRVLCMELCALSGAVYSVWGCVLCMGPCALYPRVFPPRSRALLKTDVIHLHPAQSHRWGKQTRGEAARP